MNRENAEVGKKIELFSAWISCFKWEFLPRVRSFFLAQRAAKF
jgi:hypothetical protein